MTVFESIKSKNIDELVEWLNKYCCFDTAPYMDFWDKNYCDKCEPEVVDDPDVCGELSSMYCELHDKCKYFQNMDKIPSVKECIKMWLESECDNDKCVYGTDICVMCGEYVPEGKQYCAACGEILT